MSAIIFLFGLNVEKLFNLWLRGRLYGDQHQYLTSLWHSNIEEKEIIVSDKTKEARMWSVEFFSSGIKILLPDSESKLIWDQKFWFKMLKVLFLTLIYTVTYSDLIFTTSVIFIQVINVALNLAGGFYVTLNKFIRKVPIFTFGLIYEFDPWPFVSKIGPSEFILLKVLNFQFILRSIYEQLLILSYR